MKQTQSVSEPDESLVWMVTHCTNRPRSRRCPAALLLVGILVALEALLPATPSAAKDKKPSAPKARKQDSATSVDSLTRLLARPELKGATVGAHVVRLSDGKALFARDADRQFIPASNAKL